MLKIGSHVSMSGKDMLLGSVNEAISYGATTFMFYTGAPQNTARKPVSALKVEEAKQRMSEAGISIEDLVVHAPYIINLANTIKEETFELAVRFLKEEIQRCEDIGAVRLVLHPGSHVKAGEDVGLNQIVKGLNMVLTPDSNVKIALETMAGKGSELGYNFDQIKYMIDNVEHSHLLGICLDTCHLHDSGYDLNDFDSLLDEIDNKIGLERILAIHINDSKNTQGARKDRHENIGHGYIGFELLNTIVNHPRLTDVPKILETPYIDGKAPYKEEIEMFRTQTFTNIKD